MRSDAAAGYTTCVAWDNELGSVGNTERVVHRAATKLREHAGPDIGRDWLNSYRDSVR